MLAGDETGNVVHGARTVKGVHGYQVFEPVRFESPEVFFHTGGLELEDAGRLSLAEKLVCLPVVQRDVVYVEIDALYASDVLDRILDDGERLETEEVHFDESHALHEFALVLHHVQVGVFGRCHRGELFEVVLADDDAAGMYARLPHRTFEFFGVFERVLYQRVRRFAFAGQLRRVLVSSLEGRFAFFDHQFVGNEFGKAVAVGQRQLFHPRYVPDGELRRHRAECDDLCHPLLAVLFDDVPQHVRTSVLVEVHVHIGKGDAVRVQKAFEQQVVFKGVYVRYLQTVGHDGAGSRTAARSDRYAHFACGADEVRHNEEVARKAHPFDGAQFVPDTFERLLVRFAVPFLRPFHGKCHEVKVLFGYRQPFAEPFVAGGKRIEVVSGFCLCLLRPQPLHFVQEGGLFRFVGIGHLLFEAAYLAVETTQEYPAQLRLVDDEIVR